MGIKKSLFTCQCGCNEPIPYSPRHEYPSRKPTYKVGHAHRNKFKLNRETVVKEYHELGSGFKVAEKHGVTPVAVYNMLNKMGYETIPKEKLNDHKMSLGRKWELFCLENLPGSKDCSGTDWLFPYDIEWNGYKINVKVSNPVDASYSKNKGWSFNTKTKEETDVFLCIGLDENSDFQKMFWIPSEVAKKQTTIMRNGNSKYEAYRTTFEKLNSERQLNNY